MLEGLGSRITHWHAGLVWHALGIDCSHKGRGFHGVGNLLEMANCPHTHTQTHIHTFYEENSIKWPHPSVIKQAAHTHIRKQTHTPNSRAVLDEIRSVTCRISGSKLRGQSCCQKEQSGFSTFCSEGDQGLPWVRLLQCGWAGEGDGRLDTPRNRG